MKDKLNVILSKYEAKREKLIPILHEINDEIGYVGQFSMQKVADHLNISATDVYGTATFYSFFNLEPKGKYIIRLCQNLSCDLANKSEILMILEKKLGIKVGETSPDKKFSLELTNCMGMCDKGPSMLVNKKIYSSLTGNKVKKIISELKKSKVQL